jgi:glycyl-tRNA synthetase
LYAIVYDNYKIEKINDDNEREVLTLPIELSPYKVAVLPLNNKLDVESKEIYQKILDLGISTIYDSSGNIGKRYRRQDAIGTKYCITIDFNTKETNSITIRERDSMKQETININDLKVFLSERSIH